METPRRSATSWLRSLLDTLAYWVEYALLTLFGPATLDDEHDPLVALRRDHARHRRAVHWSG